MWVYALLTVKMNKTQLFWGCFLIATLGSILDSQLSWESGKFQLARWSHEVVIFPERTTHPPPTHHMDFFLIYCILSLWCHCYVSRVFEGCLGMSGRYPECVWKLSGVCLDGQWMVFGGFQDLWKWESCKFQLARWSQKVVTFPERTTHIVDSWPSKGTVLCQALISISD